MKLRKLVNGWVHMSPELVSSYGGGWWVVEMACTCLREFLLGGSNVEKWGYHQKKNFVINNTGEYI